jgi:hypothetical protein
LRRPLRFLLEGVQDDNRVPDRRQIDHPESPCLVAHPHLSQSLPHGLERLPVRGIVALLDLAKLKPCFGTRILWKVPEKNHEDGPGCRQERLSASRTFVPK